MKNAKKLIVCGILIALMNTCSYIYFEYALYKYFNLTFRLLYSFLFYFLQLSFLKYAARSGSRMIYFFPFHWSVEIWRILTFTGLAFPFHPFSKRFYRASAIFWVSDWFPAPYTPYIELYGEPLPYHITLESIMKFFISIVAFSFSIYSINQRKKIKFEKGTVA